jgi:hypothetical protein
MSKSKIEMGINIVQCKESGNYYQSTIQYHFFPSIYSCTRHRISWLPITEKAAMEVVEELKLKRQESNEFINWACLQELRSDSYLEKTRQYWEKRRLEEAVTA